MGWFVSPALEFHSSATLAFRVRRFVLLDVTPEDRFEIWMSTGSPDPADGDYHMLADLTGFGVNGQWTDTSGIVITDTGTAHLALVYQATQNWFTISADSIVVTPDVTLGRNAPTGRPASIEGWPNPASDVLTVRWSEAPGPGVLSLCDLHGREVQSHQISGNTSSEKTVIRDLNPGVYILWFSGSHGRSTQRLVIQ